MWIVLILQISMSICKVLQSDNYLGVIMAEIIMQEESGTPSTPSSGKWKLYPKAAGWYYLDDAGVEIPLVIAPTTFTPAIANLTVGTGGTLAGRYTQVGKLVNFDVRAILGSSGFSVAGSLTLTFPVTLATYSNVTPLGIVRFRDASPATSYSGVISSNGPLGALGAGATYLTVDALSSTIPFTWAASDEIEISGTYIAA